MVERLNRIVASEVAVAAAEHASTSPLFTELLERWQVKQRGRTGRSKYQVLSEWYAAIGGPKWSRRAWEKAAEEEPIPRHRDSATAIKFGADE